MTRSVRGGGAAPTAPSVRGSAVSACRRGGSRAVNRGTAALFDRGDDRASRQNDPVVANSATLIGRDDELAQIAELLGVRPAALDGRSTDVLLAGDAGVGKTRLLGALRELAAAEGWQVYTGQCVEIGQSAAPFLPFSEVLGRLPDDDVDECAALHPALHRLLAAQRGVPTVGAFDPESASIDRSNLLRAVQACLETVARRGPLLLVVEDVHWADRSTRDVLSFLLSRPVPGGFALVITYRADDLHRRHPLRSQVAEWSRLGRVSRITLGPLDDASVRRLVAELVPEGLDARAIDAIVTRAEGNPFIVEELSSAAVDGDRHLPADLADVLLVRFDRLHESARAVARAASVAGRTVTHEMLAVTTELPVDALEDGVRGCVEMNVLVAEGGLYAFRHALLGEAIYDDLLPGERTRLHRRFVAALRDGAVHGSAAELGRHALAVGDAPTALRANVRAGAAAVAIGGYDEAAQHYQQALELLVSGRDVGEHDIDRSKLVVSAADALVASGDPGRAFAVIEDQLSLLPADADVSWRSRMLSAQAAALHVTEAPLVDAVERSERAVALAPEGDRGLRAQVLVTHARSLARSGRYEEAEAAGIDGLDLAEQLNLTDLASDAITTLANLKKTGPTEALRAALVEAVERAHASDSVRAELRGRYMLGLSFQDEGRYDEAERWFASAISRAERAGLKWAPYALDAHFQLAWTLVVRGRWDDALEVVATQLSPRPTVPDALLDSVRLIVLQRRGEDITQRAAELRPFWSRDGGVVIHASAIEMVEAGRCNDPAAAIAVYDDAVEVLSEIWHTHFDARIRLAAVAIGVVADHVATLGAGERRPLVEAVERLTRDGRLVVERSRAPGAWGPEGQAWSQRLDAEAARARWQSGIDEGAGVLDAWWATEQAFIRFGDVYELAEVRARLAGILQAVGDRAAARQLAEQARQSARDLGAIPLLECLRSIGSTSTHTAPGSPQQLTKREMEVLEHVAAGRTNGEIANLLFISIKTVSVHVSNILSKMNVGSRTEAAAAARRRQLLDEGETRGTSRS